jgi:large subunit ribosomal protein L5
MSAILVQKAVVDQQKTLMEELALTNVHALPKITKVSLNVGLNQYRNEKAAIEYITKSIAKIAGQQPVTTIARKSVAGFKVRAGETVGLRVTLRGTRMYDFLNRLLNITLPRIRDFRGLSTSSFDKDGNLTIGFKDQAPFAELGHEALDRPFGLSITISIARSDSQKSQTYLRRLGFPFKTD